MLRNKSLNQKETNQYTSASIDSRDCNVAKEPIDWERVLLSNEKWMRSVIALRVGESAAVDEVFQEVALAATKQKSPLRDISKLDSWLYKLAVLQSSLYRRRAGRKRNLLKRYESDCVASNESGADDNEPLDWLLSKERRTLVRSALQKLQEDYREILILKYCDELSYHDISRKLNMTESAVQSKLHRARILLKKEILDLSK